MTGSLNRAFHLGCPGERRKNSHVPRWSPTLSPDMCNPGFRQSREMKWSQIVRYGPDLSKDRPDYLCFSQA